MTQSSDFVLTCASNQIVNDLCSHQADIFRSPPMWLASKPVQATTAILDRVCTACKSLEFQKDRTGRPYSAPTVARQSFVTVPYREPAPPRLFGQATRYSADPQLVTEASLTKVNAQCKPVFAIGLCSFSRLYPPPPQNGNVVP